MNEMSELRWSSTPDLDRPLMVVALRGMFDAAEAATSAIDRLARSGVLFRRHYVQAPTCGASRDTLLTGRYHWRTRLQKGIVGLWGPPLIAEDRSTIGTLAKEKGYLTACIGKWHLGWDWPIPDGKKTLFRGDKAKDDVPSAEQRELWRKVFSQSINGGPTTRGFDMYFGPDVPNWPPFCLIENDRTKQDHA